MMTRASRILVLVAALALGLVFALPVWTIDLEAPQYPEGLGMVIRVNTIEGKKPNDLGNINNLNHYIGMRRIEPESIPELVWMPWLVGALLAGGVAVAALGRRKALYVWTAGYLLIAVVGLADFYRWEHDYGHNLDEEHAIIKIPGMSYQPPLLGSRQILNFTAHSWPGAGGWILVMVGVTAVAVATSELRTGRGPRVRRPRARGAALPAAAALSVLAVGMGACGAPGPRPLAVGTDVCERCHMTVADDGGGAEAIGARGRIYVFDSIECMVAWLDHDPDADSGSLWVRDRSSADGLVEAGSAHYLESAGLGSPMGLGLVAFASESARDRARAQHGGRALDWQGARALVAERWPGGQPAAGHAAHDAHAGMGAP